MEKKSIKSGEEGIEAASASTQTTSEVPQTVVNEEQSEQQQTTDNTARASRWYKIRRSFILIGIPLGIIGLISYLNEKLIIYKYLLQQLQKHTDKEKAPLKIITGALMMWASWIDLYNPHRIASLWDEFMPLLDSKYHRDIRQVALTCLFGMLSGDMNTLPPNVFYVKCRKKLDIMTDRMEGWPAEKFLSKIYEACGASEDPQVMFMALELLVQLTTTPREPTDGDIEEVIKHLGWSTASAEEQEQKRLLIKSVMYVYQDKADTIQYLQNSPVYSSLRPYIPNFGDIKRQMVRLKALDFAFQLSNANSPQMKQVGMMLLLNIVGNYPDFDELMENIGQNPEERLQNRFRIVDSLILIGQEHLMRGQSLASLQAFQEANRFLPENPTVLYFICQCLSEMDRIEEAKEHTRELIEISRGKMNPSGSMPEALYLLASLDLKHAIDENDHIEAADCLEKIIDNGLLTYCTVQPIDLTEVYYRLQLSYEKLHRYEDALNRMAKLCTLTPNATQPHVECGRLAMLCQEYELAERYLLRALELEPLDVHVKYQLCLAQFHLGDIEACERNLNGILSMRPGDPKALHLKIQIHMQQKQWNQALQIVDEMLQTKHSNSAYTHYQRAVIFEHMNNPQESRSEFEKTVHLWKENLAKLGFSAYFAPRANERKALQKIQLRCEQHKGDKNWEPLCQAVFDVGMTN